MPPGPTKAGKLSISQCLLLFQKPFPRPVGFPRFLASGAAEMGKHHKIPKIVDFVMPALFPEAISKAPWISWIFHLAQICGCVEMSLGPKP